VEKPGLIVAPLTPFTADLDVDEPALRREIDYVVRDCRATMVVAAGVETQEYSYLSLEKRKALIRHTVDCVDERVPVMVGISHPSFKTAIELAHFAENLGAGAVQLLAPLRPFAGPPTQADLTAYFAAVARETRLPIVLYLNPARRRCLHCRYGRACQTAERASHQGELARSRARLSPDRRDRPGGTCPLFHDHANAARHARARRLRRDHAATSSGDRTAYHRCFRGQGP
jgi:4-hydroxy-tetrahydrodipicolinate synthase